MSTAQSVASSVSSSVARSVAGVGSGSGGVNLIHHSEDFTNAGWTKTQTSVVSGSIAGPSVEPNGTLLNVTAFSGGHAITDNIGVSVMIGQSYVTSFYAKAKDYNYIGLLQTSPNAGKYFDILNGSVLGNFVAAPDASGIEDVGDGWFRCWIAKVMTATPHKVQLYVANTSTNVAFAGTTSLGIYIAGAQVEPGVLPGPYKKV